MRTQKQRVFSFLVLLTMAIVLTCIFVACDKGGAQDKNYTVTIHPDNGQADFVWDIKTDIPVITKYGYHIVGYYLDADMTISTTLESLKTTNLTADLNVYVKWEKDSVPPKTKIVTNNLLCNYDTRALSGKVSNSTTVFSFNDEISVEKGTTYTISTDINGINVIPSKTVNLEIGDNIFYVLVSNEDELTLYTATVRRKLIYTVTFDTLGGTEVEAQQVEEDAFATAPTTEKNGCTFEKWDWDFSMPITENTTITAIWNAFVYDIIYDFNIPEDSVSQEVDNSMNPTTYTVDDTIYFSAPARKGYYLTGWSVSNISKGTTGTVTTTAQWRPIIYEIVYDFGDDNSVSKATNNDSNPRYYSVESEINFAEPTRAGYSFVSWDKNIEKGTTGTQTVTASWNVINYAIIYNFGDTSSASKAINNELNPTTYTVENEIVFAEPTRVGYTFVSWDKSIAKGTIDAQTIAASWSIINYDITYNFDDFSSVSKAINNASNPANYTVEDEIVFEAPTRSYYNFVSWSKNIAKGSIGEQNITARWEAETHTISYVLSGWSNVDGNKDTYTIEDQTFSLFDGVSGERLFCGWYLDAEYTNYIDSIDASAMKDYTVYAMPDCGATKGLTIQNGVVKSYSGSSVDVVVPSYYKGHNVESLADTAFKNCGALTSVVIPNCVKSIGEGAFSGCSLLESITIPFVGAKAGVTSDDTYQYPFGYIFGTETYAGGVATNQSYHGYSSSSVSSETYYIPSALKSVTVTAGNILYGAFSRCSGLVNITVPNDLTNIPVAAFEDCTELRNMPIPDSVTSIGNDAFYNCVGLTNIIIPDNVTGVGARAFLGCSGLKSINIPDSVTSMSGNAFNGCTGLTNISGSANMVSTVALQATPTSFVATITKGDSIANSAFYNCKGLSSITIPNGVTSIGSYAFNGCDGLTDIYYNGDIAGWCGISGLGNLMSNLRTIYIDGKKVEGELIIPDSITSIPLYAFSGCSGLTSIAIPNSVTSIGSYAFYNCSGLVRLTTGSGVTSMSDNAFTGCAGLASISGSANITSMISKQATPISFAVSITSGDSIADSAFRDCTGLTSVTIPNSVTSIGNSAFSGCSGLTSITIPDGVTSIGDYAFQDSSSLTTVTWNAIACATVGSSYSSIFSGCSNLAIVNIGNNVTTIPSYVFYNCNGLTSITIPDSVTSIGTSAFYGCSGLINIYYIGDINKWCGISGLKELMSNSRTLYIDGNKLDGELILPNTVTAIPSYAFYGCYGLTSVTIPDSVTSIGTDAFSGCSRVFKIIGPSDAVSAVAKQCASKVIEEIVITSGTSIGNSAFYKCTGLTSITIPNSVTSIGESAFWQCSNLISVTLGNGVTNIAKRAFFGCEKLTSITIPNALESIGDSAFSGCWRLIEVHNKSSLTIIAGSSDNGCVASNAKNVYTDTEGESKLSTENGYVVYTDGTEKIVVAYKGAETELTLPSYITQINDRAFYNCAELTKVTIPNSVTSIGYDAFHGCIGLTSLTIGKRVTHIGSSAFLGCTGLTSIIVNNENTRYHSSGNCLIETATKMLILGCKTSVVPSDGSVTSIGNSAFYKCTGLTSIIIPNSVTSIGYGAFYGCSGLTNINFEGTKEQWNAITKGDNWNNGVATDCTITCSDGTI